MRYKRQGKATAIMRYRPQPAMNLGGCNESTECR